MYQGKGWEGWPEIVGKEKKTFLSFMDFQHEAQNLYPGYRNVQRWYKKEKENHPNWPASPYSTYQGKGWVGWPELVGIENRLKIEYLSFSDFQREAQNLYPGYGIVREWYHKERKNHSNWPSAPVRTYREKGWEGWPELIGKEKKTFLSFPDFQAEVRDLYPGYGNIQKWYDEERKNHSDWPSAPGYAYTKEGWTGWLELIGKEKKTFLSFADFQAEVRDLYPRQGGVEKWYHKERKNHPDWPSAPELIYKGQGWEGFPKLVGRSPK
jgi:hypothetical protein